MLKHGRAAMLFRPVRWFYNEGMGAARANAPCAVCTFCIRSRCVCEWHAAGRPLFDHKGNEDRIKFQFVQQKGGDETEV